jgi:hypothetical protein
MVIFSIPLYSYSISVYKIGRDGTIRLSNLDETGFSRTLSLKDEEFSLSEKIELSAEEIVRQFGPAGLRNLKSLGVINPTRSDIERSRKTRVPGVHAKPAIL